MKRKTLDLPQFPMPILRYLVLSCVPVILMAETVNPAGAKSTPPSNAVTSAPAQTVGVPTAGSPTANTARVAPSVPSIPEYTEDQLLTEVGWIVGKRAQLGDLGFNEAQIATILRGMTLSLEGKDAPLPLASAGPRLSTYMQNRMQVARMNAQKAAEAKQAAFFADLKAKGIHNTPSGLFYEIIQPGSDKKPAGNDSVTVNYTGRLLDGKVFDTSATRGKPAVFQLNRLIRGWSEGLQLIGEGGKIKLYIPFALAYGPANQPNIPPFSTLEFEVELVAVAPAPAVPPAVNRAPGIPHVGDHLPASGNPGAAAPVPNKAAPSNLSPAGAVSASGTNK